MKKFAVISLLLLFSIIVATTVTAASVSRSMASRVSPGEDVQVAFSVSGVKVGEVFTLEDKVPQGWLVSNWNVDGAQGDRASVDYRFVASENRHGFSFTAASASPTISFTVKVPAQAASGSYAFDTVWFDSSGFDKGSATATVRTITCGDGVCEGSENSDSCLQDCPVPEKAAPTSQLPSVPGGTSTTAVIVLVVLLAVASFLYIKFRKKKPLQAKK